MLLTRERAVERKLKETVLALRVEQALPKERIFEIYFNEIYLGQRAYGFAAAAQAYFVGPASLSFQSRPAEPGLRTGSMVRARPGQCHPAVNPSYRPSLVPGSRR
jgi:hypothetical protein